MSKTIKDNDCRYDYKERCDCSDDDNCGCTYPDNLNRGYNDACFAEKTCRPATPLSVGMAAPDFTAPAVLGDNTLIQHFNL